MSVKISRKLLSTRDGRKLISAMLAAGVSLTVSAKGGKR